MKRLVTLCENAVGALYIVRWLHATVVGLSLAVRVYIVRARSAGRGGHHSGTRQSSVDITSQRTDCRPCHLQAGPFNHQLLLSPETIFSTTVLSVFIVIIIIYIVYRLLSYSAVCSMLIVTCQILFDDQPKLNFFFFFFFFFLSHTLLERCRVHYWSQVSRLVAFFHADERPIFNGFKSASVARSQLWLGLSFGRFQSNSLPVQGRIFDWLLMWLNGDGLHLVNCGWLGQRGAVFCRLWYEREEADNQRCVGL